MKNKIGLFLSIILFFMISTFIAFNFSVNNLLIEAIKIMLYFVVLYFLYKIFYRFVYVSKKKKILILMLLGLIFNVMQIILVKSFSFEIVINLICNNLAFLLLFLYIKRRADLKTSYFTLLMFIISLPISYCISNCGILNFLMMLYLFALTSIEKDYPLGKKHLIKYSIVALSTALLFKVNMLFLIPLFIILLLKLKNNGKKVFLATTLVMMVVFCGTYLLLNNFDFELLLFETSLVYSGINEYILTFIVSLLIYSVMYMIYLFSVEGFEDINIRINYLLSICLILFILSSILDELYISYYLIFIITLFGLNSLSIRKIVLVPYYKRFKKTKKIKKVSVVIPNYNYAHYIEERIDSVLKQTYPIYELIVLDDCSSDNSDEVIEKKLELVKNKYPDLIVKYLPNKKNSGNVFKQWAKCFEVSTGDYLWIAEADDLCSKHFLNVIMQGFNDDSVVMSYAESLAIDENGKVFKRDMRDWIDMYHTGRWTHDYICDGKLEMEEAMCTNNTIANVSSLVFKKDSKISVNEYLKEAQNYRLAGDWLFYTKYLLFGAVAYSCDSLNYHRIHRNSVTTTTDNFLRYKEVCSVQDSIHKDIVLSDEALFRIEDTRSILRREYCISEDELYYDSIELEDLIKSKKIKDDVLLSIIIPVYNVEPYLKKCLSSFIKTLPIKTEVIIINDGSPDNSEEIILDFASKFDQIKYIKKENGGLSSVKNRGLKEANGRYVIYLDSDDYVAGNMYSTMLKKAIDTDSDIVYSDVLVVYEDGRVEYSSMTNYNRKDNLMRILDGPLMAASWNKMIRRSLYEGLEFPEGKNNEDVAVSPLLFVRSNKTTNIPSPFYKYLQRSGSIQNSGFNEKRFVIFDTAKLCFDSISKMSYLIQEKIIGSIITHQIIGLLLYSIADIDNKKERLDFIKMYCDRFNDLISNNDLDLEYNQYVCEYLNYYNMKNLLELISNYNIEEIDKNIRRR